jgi:CRP-like cAMP-binding protein
MLSEIRSRDALTGNHLLDALPSEELARLPLKNVSLQLGEVMYDFGQRTDVTYFPTTCVVSCLYTTRTGATAETALVGNDGVLGISSFLGGGACAHRAVAQVAGDALRIPANAIQAEFARGGVFQSVALRYTHALISQISQTAVCNRLHSLEQRLCRWLLLCHDRLTVSEFLMTQEFIGNMLGGRRESVTVAAGHLQDLGLIRYSRGHISIIDRPGLERIACECYEVVQEVVENHSGVAQPHRSASARDPRLPRDGAIFSTG